MNDIKVGDRVRSTEDKYPLLTTGTVVKTDHGGMYPYLIDWDNYDWGNFEPGRYPHKREEFELIEEEA